MKHTRDPYGGIVVPTCTATTYQADSVANLELRFQWLLGLQPMPEEMRDQRFIYSRFETPTHDSLYRALVAMEPGAAEAAVFPSGMSAIFTTIMAIAQQGDTILYTTPEYGCSDEFYRTWCARYGITAVAVDTTDLAAFEQALLEHQFQLRAVFLETPNNPRIGHSPIRQIADLTKKYPGLKGPALIVVDNTFLGPLFQHPFEHGADIVVYSATKFLGGHSCQLGGVALTNSGELMKCIRSLQYTSGPIYTPAACADLEQSIADVFGRMRDEAASAAQIASMLAQHGQVAEVYYSTLLTGVQAEIYAAQCTGPGSIISLRLKGGAAAAEMFVNSLEVVYGNTVSLGSDHSLAILPARSTHLGVPEDVRIAAGVTPDLVRLSIGLEPVDRLIEDITQSLAQCG
ncbi:MAG: aminotransferase class I/II-fold pyridoxal phosphate-dependent enzyme [Patescibacteria group bacterium]